MIFAWVHKVNVHILIHKEVNIHILIMFCSSIDRGSQQSKWLVIVPSSLET